MVGIVAGVYARDTHSLRKTPQPRIQLLAGLGVRGDAHLGATVKHQSRVARDAAPPNLRQVHLVAAELHDELRAAGFAVGGGEMGENITTRDVDLLSLPTRARLRLGADAVVEITGLRNPCAQLNTLQDGLMAAVLDRDADGKLVRKAGVMGIVVTSGSIETGDRIEVELPALPHRALEPV